MDKVSSNHSLSVQGRGSDSERADSAVAATTYEGLNLGLKSHQGFGAVHSSAFLAEGCAKKQVMCRPMCTGRANEKMSREGFANDSGPIIPNGLPKENVCNVRMKHWWESPAGKSSQGRAVTSTFPVHHAQANGSPIESPAKSDVTFEGGSIWKQNSDTSSESTPIDSSAFNARMHPSDGDRSQELPLESTPDTGISSKLGTSQDSEHILTPESGEESHQEGSEKEKGNKWSEEEGKMVIGTDVFSAVLPSADEVGLQWRISELRVALRASESARLESERETEALRNYLSEVEAAAASLQSRVHELEHLISFSSKEETRELDQLRAKLATEASKEARNQAVAAAQSVAAAREATMELDRVKRHASALIKAQEEEIERLSMEAAECRTLYNARSAQLQAMKDQIDKLEQKLKQQSKASEEALQASHQEIVNLQKLIESTKIEAAEKVNKCNELQETLEYTKCLAQAAERQLDESEREKKELTGHNEWLEQRQVEKFTRNQVKAVLEGEKQHLLTELALLRRGNQTLQGEVTEWQEKFHALSRHISGIESISSTHKPAISILESKLSSGNDQPSSTFEIKSPSELQHPEQDQGKVFPKPSGCATKESLQESNACPDRRVGNGQFVTPIQMKSSHRIQYSLSNSEPEIHDTVLNGKWGINVQECKVPVTTPNCGKSVSSHEASKLNNVTDCGSCQKTSCVLLRENLLAAAHTEIVKLKEINHCLVAAWSETKPAK